MGCKRQEVVDRGKRSKGLSRTLAADVVLSTSYLLGYTAWTQGMTWATRRADGERAACFMTPGGPTSCWIAYHETHPSMCHSVRAASSIVPTSEVLLMGASPAVLSLVAMLR